MRGNKESFRTYGIRHYKEGALGNIYFTAYLLSAVVGQRQSSTTAYCGNKYNMKSFQI